MGKDGNLQVRYIRPATGHVTVDHFELVAAPIPVARDGEFVVRNVFLSLDPYQRRQMIPGVVYPQPLHVGDVMVGRTVGEVIESRHPGYAVGDWVRGSLGWQLFSASDGRWVEKIEPGDGFPPSLYLGILGSPGMTAWVGLRHIAKIRPGETVVISAATGAVAGAAVGLAKASGCRVVGIAGGERKCAHAVDVLGYDACIDYRARRWVDQLAQAVPSGVDVDFENVGGPVFEAVVDHLNDFARIALCGLVSEYDRARPYGIRNLMQFSNHDVMLHAFRIRNYADCYPAATRELKDRLRKGEVVVREAISDGLASAPSAFVAMLSGAHLGKALVRLQP